MSERKRAHRSPKTDLSQVDRCYAQLRELIVSCELKPGQRLTEKALIARSGFGRTPVREALARLDHDGLVHTRPRSGYQVVPLTHKSISDLFDVWALIGPLIARRASENMTPEIRAELQAIAGDGKDGEVGLQDGHSRSWRFFDLLARATDNYELIYINHRMSSELERIWVRFLATPSGQAWNLSHGANVRETHAFDDPGLAALRVSLAIAESRTAILRLFDDDQPSGRQAAR